MRYLEYLLFWKNYFLLKIITPKALLWRNLNGMSANVSGLKNENLRFPDELPLLKADADDTQTVNKILTIGLLKKVDISKLKKEFTKLIPETSGLLYPYLIINNLSAMSHIFCFKSDHASTLISNLRKNEFEYSILSSHNKNANSSSSYFEGFTPRHFRLLIQNDYYREKAGIMVYHDLLSMWAENDVIVKILEFLKPFFITRVDRIVKSKNYYKSISSLRFDPKMMIQFLALDNKASTSIKFRACKIGITTKKKYVLVMQYKTRDTSTRQTTSDIRRKLNIFRVNSKQGYNEYISVYFGVRSSVLF